jgi:hypothetical protein
MSIRSRLERLERVLPRDGRCPECGFRPDDIRTAYIVCIGRLPDGLWSDPPDPPDPPGRERCSACGGWARFEFVEGERGAQGKRSVGDELPESFTPC